MQVKEAIENRRSVRKYLPKLVPDQKLNNVLEAARLAPSAHNSQSWKFVVVKDEILRNTLAEIANQGFISQAPVIIAAVGLDPKDVMKAGVPSYAVDLAIAVDHMTLQAVEEGLATCWIGSFDQDAAKELLEIPMEYIIVALLPLGYPGDTVKPKLRKSLEQIVSFDTFK